MWSGGWRIGFGCRQPLSHRASLQGELVSAVDQPVEDGIGECGVSNVLMPVLDGELTGDHRGLGAITILQDLEQITAFHVGEWCEPQSSRIRSLNRSGIVGGSKP